MLQWDLLHVHFWLHRGYQDDHRDPDHCGWKGDGSVNRTINKDYVVEWEWAVWFHLFQRYECFIIDWLYESVSMDVIADTFCVLISYDLISIRHLSTKTWCPALELTPQTLSIQYITLNLMLEKLTVCLIEIEWCNFADSQCGGPATLSAEFFLFARFPW